MIPDEPLYAPVRCDGDPEDPINNIKDFCNVSSVTVYNEPFSENYHQQNRKISGIYIIKSFLFL